MALIKCSECGKEISDKAEICVNCGCPIQKEKSNFNKYNKPFNELSKKEKQDVSKQATKDTTYIMFNVALIVLVIFDVILFPTLIALFINVPLLIIQVIVDKILIKKYYNEKLYFGSEKENIKEQNLYIEKDKMTIIKENMQENVKPYNNWFLVIIIGCIIVAMFIFFNRTGRIIKKWNRVLVYYDLSKNICCLLPCIMLLLSYFYDKTRKVILKKIVKIISIISIVMLLMFLCYWWFNVIPQNNGWSIYNYDTDFIFYNLLLIVANYMIIQKIDKIRK